MKSMEAKEAASSLIEIALANGGKDNITITLISFKKTINKNIEKQNYREHETPLKREKRKME
jgi:serine/threonine protein phosphatase PrpC